jgi:thiol-disulfide isomerase/thioredoxin
MFNPQNVWLKIEGSTQTTVFAKPGETLCISFNKLLKEVTADDRKRKGVDDWQINHSMGESGLLSEELVLLESFVIGLDPNNLIINNMRDMPQLSYQKWRKQWYVNETHFLDSLYQTMNCSAKARQVMNISEELSLIEDLLVYPYESGSFGQFSQKYIDGVPKSSYSPELNLLYSDYGAYIMYRVNFYTMQTLGGLNPSQIKAYMDFFARHISDTSDLKIINEWNAKYADYSWPELYDRLEPDDRQNDSLLNRNSNNYRRSYFKMTQKYGSIISENFRDSLYISEFDFVLDVYNSDLTGQMYCVYHLQQFQKKKPLNATYVNWAKRRITYAVLLNYLLEANKVKEVITKKYTTYATGTHFIDCITCDKNSDAFFIAILKKFEGKVVYIDFWADWCSPCRAEFEPAAKLKQEYAGKDIVFLYFGINCKKNLWEDMIKEKQLEGYHYWLNKDQGEVMYKKFNFKGIPHFVLIDKTGKVQAREAPTPSSQAEIRERLEELLKL